MFDPLHNGHEDLRTRLRIFLSQPDSSQSAFTFYLFISLIIIVWCAVMILETVPGFIQSSWSLNVYIVFILSVGIFKT